MLHFPLEWWPILTLWHCWRVSQSGQYHCHLFPDPWQTLALQVLFGPDLFVSSICSFNPIHPLKSFIWLCKSSSAWQIKAILSKIIYGSCSSLSFPLNPLCSIPIDILTILLHFYVFYSSSSAVVLSLCLNVHECDETQTNVRNQAQLSSFLTNSQWYLLTVYGGQQRQPWEINFKERDGRRKGKKEGRNKWMKSWWERGVESPIPQWDRESESMKTGWIIDEIKLLRDLYAN